jgi:hypothetical protein
MKISLTLTAIIVVLFVFFGGQVRQRLSGARENHDRILAEATARGLDAAVDGKEPALSPRTAAARAENQKAREAKAREAARKLMIFGNDRGPIDSPGLDGDPAKQLDFQEGLAEATELDSAGLKLLVSEIIANGGLTEEMRARLILEVGSNMTQKNPLGAIDLFMDANNRLKLPGNWFSSIIGNSLQSLAANDPKQATEWIQRQAQDHPELVNANLRADVLVGIGQANLGLAFSTLDEFGLTKDPGTLEGLGIVGAKTAEARNSLLAAMRDYAAHTSSDEERELATRNTMAGMGRFMINAGYDSASQWLGSAKLSPDEAAGLASGLDASLAKGDTGKWIDWISGNVPADQLGGKVDELMKSWTESDYRAAGTWLDSAPDGPAKQAAVLSYASTVAATDPAAASQWAQTLPAGDDRTALMKNIYAEWKKQDEAAAAKFAKENGIGE